MTQFYDTCHDLHMDVLRSVALGLEMDEKFFDPLANEKWHTLRLLNYPPVAKKLLEDEGQSRAGAHSGVISNKHGPITAAILTDHLRLWFNHICIPG